MSTYDPNDPIDRLALSGARLLMETPSTSPEEMAEIVAGLVGLPGKPEAGEKESTPVCEHTWTEDGETFTVKEDPHSDLPELIGPRFHGGTWNEGPLAREVLRQAELIESLRILARQNLDHHRTSYRDVLAELAKASKESEELATNNARLTDCVNALTARIEEALDLLIGEVDSSRRVEEAYQKLETVLLNKRGFK